MICENGDIISTSTGIYNDILSEVKEMETLLDSLANGTKALIEPDTKKSVHRRNLSQEEKRQTSKSAWARSRTPIAASVVPNPTAGGEQLEEHLSKADKATRVKTPSYSFGIANSCSHNNCEKPHPTPGPTSYVVNEDMLSTRSRLQAPSFPKCKRQSEQTLDDDLYPALPDDQKTKEKVISVETKGVRFGKASRFPAHVNKTSATDNGDIDIIKPKKYCQPHVPGVIMAPPTVKGIKHENGALENFVPLPSEKSCEALSTHFKSPAISINPLPNPVEKVSHAKVVDVGTPGPGHYEVNVQSMNHVLRGAGKQTGFLFKPLRRNGEVFENPEKHQNFIRKKEEERFLEDTRGPGLYNPTTPTKVVAPKFVSDRSYADSDAKISDRLERKRYFEQKAADMREAHDELRIPDDRIFRKRVPVVSFGAPEKSTNALKKDVTFKVDNDIVETRSERAKLLYDIDKLMDEENHQHSSVISYNQVEKRSVGMVSMKAEVTARENTQHILRAKPEVLKVISDKSEGLAAQNKFYGPQLPVPWAPGQSILVARNKRRRDGSETSRTSSESPTAEILELLEASDRRDLDDPQSEYAEAFLKSSYSGSNFKKNNAIKFRTNSNDYERNAFHKKVDPDLVDLEFFGPQLQQNWIENVNRHPHHSMDLNKNRGREKIKVLGKGMVSLQNFDDHHVVKDESSLAPGIYDVMTPFDIAKQAKGVPFSRQIAREDAVGVHGEKPPSAADNINNLIVGDDIILNKEHLLDLDYGLAKDKMGKKTDKNLVFYTKDREIGEKAKKDNSDENHLGGSWFEGMFEGVLKNGGKALEFSKMMGRHEISDREEVLIMNEVVGEDIALDLEVKDWHPHRPLQKGITFNDPQKYPRFPAEKKSDKTVDVPPTPDVNYTLIDERPQLVVNMDKMRGRFDESQSENNQIEDIVHGSINFKVAGEVAQERASGIAGGIDYMMRRGPKYVEMDKQLGRHNDLEARKFDERLINHEIGEEGKLFTKIIDEDGHKRTKGTLDWSKQIGRSELGDSDIVDSDDAFLENGELDLVPNPNASSKYPRVKSGLDWKHQEERFISKDIIEAAMGMQVGEGEILDLDIIHENGFVMTKNGQADNKPTYNMSNQVGRSLAEDLSIGISQGLGIEEKPELILDPTNQALQKKAQGGTSLKSNVPRFPATGAEQFLSAEEETFAKGEKDVLDLRPTDAVLRRHRPGTTAMASKQLRFPSVAHREEETIMKGLSVENQQLQLDPNDIAVRRSSNLEGAVAMRQSASRIATIAEQKVLKEEEAFVKLELDIKTFENDTSFQNRIKGGSALRSSTERIASFNELQVHENIRKSTKEELRIDPEIKSSRVNLGNVSSLANKEVRTVNKINAARPMKKETPLKQQGLKANDYRQKNVKGGKRSLAPSSIISPININAPLPTGKKPDVESYNVDKLKQQLAELGL